MKKTVTSQAKSHGQSIRFGLDIAKLVFQIHGINANSAETVMVKKLVSHKMLRFFTNKQPMLIGISACGGETKCAFCLSKI